MQEIKNWTPAINDFNLGELLMLTEDYSKTVYQNYQNPQENPHYSALLYSVLSWREKFNQHKKQFYEFLENDLWTSYSILKNKDRVKDILEKYGFSERKIKCVLSTAENWEHLDLTKRIRKDEEKIKGKELREEMVESMDGVGHKFASLFLRMSGYENMVPVDSWATKYVESRGFKFRDSRSGFKPNQYLKYEEKLTEYAKEFGVSPALFQATIYAKWSTWAKDAKIFPQ